MIRPEQRVLKEHVALKSRPRLRNVEMRSFAVRAEDRDELDGAFDGAKPVETILIAGIE